MKFNDPTLQRKFDDLIAMENSPEFLEKKRLSLAEDKKYFWKVYSPLCAMLFVLVALVPPLLIQWLLPGLGITISWNWTVIAAELALQMGAFLYPVDEEGWLLRVLLSEAILLGSIWYLRYQIG